MTHSYDGCELCQHEAAQRLARMARAGVVVILRGTDRPTAAALEKHAKKYGPAQVPETAAELGLGVTVEPAKPKARTRRPSLKKRVARLLAEGHSVEAIAEVENLTPGRARRLVEELS